LSWTNWDDIRRWLQTKSTGSELEQTQNLLDIAGGTAYKWDKGPYRGWKETLGVRGSP
jgi:hypothetical protein